MALDRRADQMASSSFHDEYSLIYLRTLKDNYSNEYKVFKKVGFTKMPDVIEVVKRKRTRLMKEEDCRFFWQLKLN